MVDQRSRTLQIVCSTNDRFAADCAVMLASLMETNPAGSIDVRLLHDQSLPVAAVEALRELVVASGGRCEPIEVPPDGAGWPSSDRFPANAWYRVRLPELLPELKRVLYIDADALLTAPIEDLWATELEGALLGAITNPLYKSMVRRIQVDIGVRDVTEYFNSGVLLIDLDAWRAEGVTDAIRAFVNSHSLVWPDQDALNGVLHSRRLALHPRWNAMPGLWELPRRYLPYTTAQIREAKADPAIVHFVGPYKPWHFRSRHPYRETWFRELERTPWRGRSVEGRSAWQAALRPMPAHWAYRLEVGAARVGHELYMGRQRVRARLR